MRIVGYGEEQLCSEVGDRCMKEFSERFEKNLDGATRDRMTEACNKQTEAVCEKVNKICE
jgi:hypothetical protein